MGEIKSFLPAAGGWSRLASGWAHPAAESTDPPARVRRFASARPVKIATAMLLVVALGALVFKLHSISLSHDAFLATFGNHHRFLADIGAVAAVGGEGLSSDGAPQDNEAPDKKHVEVDKAQTVKNTEPLGIDSSRTSGGLIHVSSKRADIQSNRGAVEHTQAQKDGALDQPAVPSNISSVKTNRDHIDDIEVRQGESRVAAPVLNESKLSRADSPSELAGSDASRMQPLRQTCAEEALSFRKWPCEQKGGLRMLGDKVYGGWKMCVEGIHEMAKEQREALVVYGFGIGFDTSWDEALMSQYGLNVHAFDPTPRSLEYVRGRKELQTPLFHHSAVGLGTTNRNETWYEPRKGRWEASNSKYNHLKDGIAHEVEVKTLKTLMQERGHTHIDVLKIDIEGAEYEVLVDLLKDGGCLPTNQLLMETHSYQMKQLWKAHGETVALLEQAGFRLVFAGPGDHEHTWIRFEEEKGEKTNQKDSV
ncbi:Methyltransferase-like protein 24 [Porphyridium purpureum]|uniref:Methyltransferase-like protein 24 n=1 Tax=Porphyridium purpureum TaxID=35688 RepID=A0A5J4YRW3_PORPP|nr:Methyltransferase-like protein 24 [Porphyridium purpureum]|eukprot:POR3962..scf236_6